MRRVEDRDRLKKFLATDSYLHPYAEAIARRIDSVSRMEQRLTGGRMSLTEFANGKSYFGLHFENDGWVFREWAPHATAVFLVGEFSDWQALPEYRLERIGADGDWQIRLPAERLQHGNLYRLKVYWPGGEGDRIPAWADRVVQDDRTFIFNAQVWAPLNGYRWKHSHFRVSREPPLIYEAHVGMSQEEERVGTYREFRERVLPRIVAGGYNVIQLMAIPEHPYYGSFGYHVSSFFAASSRFGTPEELKALIDAAHEQGIAVIMDLVHSHAVNNEVEGLSRFDGSDYQYFHSGHRGRHHLWDSRLFDFTKPPVLHFLLSNCRYWLDEYRVDGFRFDGVTSMLYLHHGLGKAFTNYGDYFDESVDESALVYLTLANRLIHDLRADAITIGEDVSGMPGLARPWAEGGAGFDYRYAMGVPDYWIKLTKDMRDEDWPMGPLWHELTNRRHDEKTISYAESHDQSLVGDQTLIFRLIGADMYGHMAADDPHPHVARGMALHKMIRLITLASAGHGYMNFMGNEFGHPEWIDFPRPGNDWSYRYARRQWHLVDDPHLKYRWLDRFDKAMIDLAKRFKLLQSVSIHLLHEHNDDKIIAFERAGLILAFNFHPTRSFPDYSFPAPAGKYVTVLNSDNPEFGGHDRIDESQPHFALPAPGPSYGSNRLSLYLPNRTGVILAPT